MVPVSDEMSVDEALAEINEIIEQLNAMGPADPGRAELIARRDELRKSAQDASVASRSEDILRYERDQARRRLAEIEARSAERAKAEKSPLRWIIDPGSEANRINRMLKEQDAAARDELERRILEIEVLLDDTAPGRAGSERLHPNGGGGADRPSVDG
jgi:hypothetical protein